MGKTVEEAEREEMPSGVVGLRNLGKRTAETVFAMCLCPPNLLAHLLLLLLLLLLLRPYLVAQGSVLIVSCQEYVNSVGLMPAINEQLQHLHDQQPQL